jgi:hypothetical protein
MESNKNCETFRDFYYHLFETVNYDYWKDTGERIKPYKEYEPDLLIKFCINYEDASDIQTQLVKLLSGLIVLQSLPNANHRTAFRLIDHYLEFVCEKNIKVYFEVKDIYDSFYEKSKQIIDNDINHEYLFHENYHDAHHFMGIANHLKFSKELIEKILPPQSGIIDAVPFQRFITSLYQSGSSSSLNQRGTE